MHVPASSDFITEVKVPQADPPALQLPTLYRHPVVEAGLCSPVTRALFVFQDMFDFLTKKNVRQYIYKVNYLHVYDYFSKFF